MLGRKAPISSLLEPQKYKNIEINGGVFGTHIKHLIAFFYIQALFGKQEKWHFSDFMAFLLR